MLKNLQVIDMEPRDAYRKINLLRWSDYVLGAKKEPAAARPERLPPPNFYNSTVLRAMYMHVQQIEYRIR